MSLRLLLMALAIKIQLTWLELDYMEGCDTDAHAQAEYVTNATGSSTALITQDYADTVGLIGDWGGVEYRFAESFPLSITTKIDKVMIDVDAVGGGSPSSAFTVRIETDNAGLPSGTLAHANATANGTFVADTYVTVDFTDFDLEPGTYWIVIVVANQADNNVWQVHFGGSNRYTDGRVAKSLDGGSSWALYGEEYDLTFRLYCIGAPSLQSYSESSDKTQGSYALRIEAAITDSLNKTLTKTFASPYDLSDKTQIKYDVKASRTGSNFKTGFHDSGGTTTEHTPNIITADTWQTETVDISGVSNANKDVINQLILTILNADAANTIRIDNIRYA